MKKILLFITVLLVSSSMYADVVVNGINYYFTGSDAWVRPVNDQTFYSGDVEIPATVTYNDKTYNVVQISPYAFESQTQMTSITLPNSIKTIGDYAFSKSGIESVTLSTNESCTTLSDGAFYECAKLKSIVIPDNIKYIKQFCFYGCTALESVTLSSGGSESSVSQYAFCNCTSLTSFQVPAKTHMEVSSYPVFAGCTSLTTFTVEDGNAYYKAVDGVLYDKYGRTLNVYPAGKSGAFTVPSTVTSISSHAFDGCVGLTSLTIPSSVTSISSVATQSGLTAITVDGANANYTSENGILFSKDMTKLLCYPSAKAGTTYSIPATVTSIDASAFKNTALYKDPDNWENGVMYIDNCIVATKTSELPASLSIKADTRLIPDKAFNYCTSLTEVEIPATVKGIGTQAFLGCSKLENITIHSGVEYIGSLAFNGTKYYNNAENWDATKTLYIGEYLIKFDNDNAPDTDNYIVKNGTTLIAHSAFYSNDKLTGTFTLPASVKYINMSNFRYAAFDNFKILTATPPVLQLTSSEPLMAYTTKSNIKLQVPCVSAYSSAAQWSDFTNNEEIGYEGLLTVAANDDAKGTVAITKQPTCSDQTAEISATPKDNYRFVQWDNGATSAVLPITDLSKLNWTAQFELKPAPVKGDTITYEYKGNKLYYKVERIASPNLNQVYIVGDGGDPYSWEEANKPTGALVIPDSIEDWYGTKYAVGGIYARALRGGSDKITSIDFSENKSIKATGEQAFMGCTNVTEIILSDYIESISEYSFDGCKLSSLDLKNVTTIGMTNFGSCTNLKTVNIPKSVRTIADQTRLFRYATTITCAEDNAKFVAVDNILYSKDTTKLIAVPAGCSAEQEIHISTTATQALFAAMQGAEATIFINSQIAFDYKGESNSPNGKVVVGCGLSDYYTTGDFKPGESGSNFQSVTSVSEQLLWSVQAQAGENGSATIIDTASCNQVHLRAVPSAHYVLDKWSNGLTDADITIDITSDTILTASFKKERYRVAFYEYAGDAENEENKLKGTTVDYQYDLSALADEAKAELATPVCAKFLGWTKDGTHLFDLTSISEAANLYPKWQYNATFTIVFINNANGNVIATESDIVCEDDAMTPAAPEGFHWQWDSELYKNVYADAEIRGTLVEDGGTAVNNLSAEDGKVMKVLRDGQLYLIYKGTMYNVQGAKTK
ncbi:MAG: leucine-rich repeat domain-containing protein [Paludibacteraceae bacterium]